MVESRKPVWTTLAQNFVNKNMKNWGVYLTVAVMSDSRCKSYILFISLCKESSFMFIMKIFITYPRR